MLERAETLEVIGLNILRLRSTRLQILAVSSWLKALLILDCVMKFSENRVSLPRVRMACVVTLLGLLIVGTLPVSAQATNPMPANMLKVLALAQGAPPMHDGFLAWDASSKTVGATNGQGVARLFCQQ